MARNSLRPVRCSSQNARREAERSWNRWIDPGPQEAYTTSTPKPYTGRRALWLDVTNTALARAFDEESAFTDDGFWDLEGMWRSEEGRQGSWLWHPGLPANTLIRWASAVYAYWNNEQGQWRMIGLTGERGSTYEAGAPDPLELLTEEGFDRGWVALPYDLEEPLDVLTQRLRGEQS